MPIEENINAIKARIEKASGEGLGSLTGSGGAQLIAVSKTRPVAEIEAALGAGQRLFGENRVQEAAEKFPGLRVRYPDLKLHLIGPLQSNKAGQAVALFDVIQTVDREKIAKALAREIARAGKSPRLFVQVNVGEEPQKAGVAPSALSDFLALCRDEQKLRIEGLMCIPPVDEEPSPYFYMMRQLASDHKITRLSMGMSADFETAVQFGADYVRVGTAIFGPRG